MRGSQLDAVLNLVDGDLAGDVVQNGECEGKRLPHAGGGDDVAIDDHGTLSGMTALGEAAVKTWEARGAMSLQNAQFGQDEWGGANGGDVSGGGELTHELADALVGAQVRGSGEPPGSTM